MSSAANPSAANERSVPAQGAAAHQNGTPEGAREGKGWRVVKSGELFSFVTSGSRGWAKHYSDAGPVFLRVGNLDHDSITLDLDEIQRVNPPMGAEGTRTKVEPSDILISITADVGMVGLVPLGFEEAYINQHVALARPVSTVDPAYLAWFLASPHAQRQFQDLQRGATKVGLGLSDIRSVDVLLPPLDQQRRIVAEIEKQFTRLDAGVAALRRAQVNLKRLRAAILNEATKVAWPSMLISEISEIVTGSTPSPKDLENYGGTLPFVKPTDLNAGYFVQSADAHLSFAGARLARVLPARTVLVTCIGATIGKCGLARISCATNQQINAVIPHDHVALPEWIFWMLSSPRGQAQIRMNSSATTLPIINKRRFGMISLPVPPLAEQESIIKEIERRLSVVESLDQVICSNLRRADRFRQSILNSVFLSGR